jgi:hypothetical protein
MNTELQRWRIWFLASLLLTAFLGFITVWASIYDTWDSFALLAACFAIVGLYTWFLMRAGVSLIWHSGQIDRSLDAVARAFDSVAQDDKRPK